MKERQLQAIRGDLRRSGGNMGFLQKRAFDHFSQFGIEGLLSVSSILISVLLERVPIIFYYVNFLAVSRMPFPAITGDFPERYFGIAVNAGNGDRKSKSEIRISRIQMLIEDQVSIENLMSIIEKRRSEMRKIEKPKIQNRVTGVPSPRVFSIAREISQVFCRSFLSYYFSPGLFITSVRLYFKMGSGLPDVFDNHDSQLLVASRTFSMGERGDWLWGPR